MRRTGQQGGRQGEGREGGREGKEEGGGGNDHNDKHGGSQGSGVEVVVWGEVVVRGRRVNKRTNRRYFVFGKVGYDSDTFTDN